MPYSPISLLQNKEHLWQKGGRIEFGSIKKIITNLRERV